MKVNFSLMAILMVCCILVCNSCKKEPLLSNENRRTLLPLSGLELRQDSINPVSTTLSPNQLTLLNSVKPDLLINDDVQAYIQAGETFKLGALVWELTVVLDKPDNLTLYIPFVKNSQIDFALRMEVNTTTHQLLALNFARRTAQSPVKDALIDAYGSGILDHRQFIWDFMTERLTGIYQLPAELPEVEINEANSNPITVNISSSGEQPGGGDGLYANDCIEIQVITWYERVLIDCGSGCEGTPDYIAPTYEYHTYHETVEWYDPDCSDGVNNGNFTGGGGGGGTPVNPWKEHDNTFMSTYWLWLLEHYNSSWCSEVTGVQVPCDRQLWHWWSKYKQDRASNEICKENVIQITEFLQENTQSGEVDLAADAAVSCLLSNHDVPMEDVDCEQINSDISGPEGLDYLKTNYDAYFSHPPATSYAQNGPAPLRDICDFSFEINTSFPHGDAPDIISVYAHEVPNGNVPDDAEMRVHEFLTTVYNGDVYSRGIFEMVLASWSDYIDLNNFLADYPNDQDALNAVSTYLKLRLYGYLVGPYPENERDLRYLDWGFNFPEIDFSEFQLHVAMILYHDGWLAAHTPILFAKAFYNMNKDVIHFALDVCGMVEGLGAICDLTNGVLYTIEGDGINASMSFSATIPIVGAGVTASKYAGILIETASTVVKVMPIKITSLGIAFKLPRGTSFRQILEITDPLLEAHHLIPQAKGGHDVIQKAARSSSKPWHMHHIKNGVPAKKFRIETSPDGIHANHPNYNNQVQDVLDDIKDQFTTNGTIWDEVDPNQIADRLEDFQSYLRNLIESNPTTKINDLIIDYSF